LIILEAKDCCTFSNQEGHADAIQYFISTQNKCNVFQFDISKEVRFDESPIISFNYTDGKWYAGRYIGEAFFKYQNKDYQILIKPRFGNTQLFRMLEEVFNIRFNESNQFINKNKDFQFIIKKIIAFLWLNMLSKANVHGLPRSNKKQTYVGPKLRGRLNVRASIIPLHTESKLVSIYWEKSPNEPVVKVLSQAHEILRHEYGIAQIKASKAAKNAIDLLHSASVSKKHITDNEYKNIAYKNIYKSYKPVVDLSWDIVKRKNFGNNKDSNSEGMSFFLDMAEIWELYLKNIIKKKLAPDGWVLRNDIIQTYNKNDFRRKMIPDIVFQKNNNVLVWDAKYKRMQYDYFDYDRGDFFQIHTYINYYQKKYFVVAGGLLYPLTKSYSSEVENLNTSTSLFGEQKDSIQYFIDGIDLSEIEMESIIREEKNFLNRIQNRVSIKNKL
jgi:5-methylcytosine-specific restriction enzyme subunit McrC